MTQQGKKLLHDYFSGRLVGLVAQAKALTELKHKLTKGELREIFLKGLLEDFLPNYLSVGSGVIINNQGDQSHATDIVIYDNRILPPLLNSGDLNVYPIEALVSTIEVKSFLNLPALKSSDKKAGYLINNVWKNNNWLNRKPKYGPGCSVFAFDGNRIRKLSTDNNDWISKEICFLNLICSVRNFSWALIKISGKSEWRYGGAAEDFTEIRRFISILVDNLRTVANSNWVELSKIHNDWLSQYVRG